MMRALGISRLGGAPVGATPSSGQPRPELRAIVPTLFAVVSVTIALAQLTPARALAQSPTHLIVTPDELSWSAMPTLPPGAQVVIIQGPLNAPGPFILRLRFPADYAIPPHWHPWMEHATVMSGTLNIGVGDIFDRSKTTALPAGSVAVLQPDTRHFAWTSEETVVQVHGIGPLVIHYVNPADDPRRSPR
jgi:quercetin dioxygenase-like cupin family protein